MNRVWNSGDLRFAFAAELWDEKGKEIPVSFCFLKTDCYEGETVGYETQFLENFDSSHLWNSCSKKALNRMPEK